jgi:TRAP-type C4-dicarboxylate transport system permease small subunit
MTFVQILYSNFFYIGFSQIEVISRHLILFIIFMGAALVSEQNKHIKIDILTPFLSLTQQQKLTRPLLFICATVCAFFCWYSIGFWLDEWQYVPSNERWSVYLALILPIGFFILSFHLLLLIFTYFEPQRILIESPPIQEFSSQSSISQSSSSRNSPIQPAQSDIST